MTHSLRGQTALACGNRTAVRAGTRVSQERTDAFGGLRREDVFELAGLFRDLFFVVNLEGLGKQPFGQAVPPDDVFRAIPASLSEDDHVIAMAGVLAGWTKRYMAAVEHLLVCVGLQSVLGEVYQPYALHALQRQPHRQSALYFHATQLGGLAIFRQDP